MNPMTNIKNVLKLSEQELRSSMKTSWHDQYKHSAWVFVGGLPYDLTEGDVICVFSQYGEVVNINLVRDKDTGKSKGFCFLCYEDQRSTNLAVDNFNGIKLLNRTIRVDHCEDYKAPKDDKMDEEVRQLHAEGCAPGSKFGHSLQLPSSSSGGLDKGLNLPPMESLLKIKKDNDESPRKSKDKKEKKMEKKKEKKNKDEIKRIFKKKRKDEISSSSSSDSGSESDDSHSKQKKTVIKVKRKRKESSSSSSSSEESETENRRSKKEIPAKVETKSHHKQSSSGNDSESDGKKSARKGPHEGKETEPKKHKNDGFRGDSRYAGKHDFPNKRGKDFRLETNREERFGSHRSYKDTDRVREDDSYSQNAKNRGDNKWKEDNRKYGSERSSRDGRRDDREKNCGGNKHREESYKYDDDFKRRDDRRDSEYYRKKDSGRRY